MMTYAISKDESPRTNSETTSQSGNDHLLANASYRRPTQMRWGVYHASNPVPVAYGQVDFLAFATRFRDLLKLERQHRERLAGVSLDPAAQKLLSVLDRETSVRWEDLPEKAECLWGEASRSAALLVGANLCEVSPTRIRLNEHGDELLAESSLTGEVSRNVAS